MKNTRTAILYSLVTLVATFVVGQILLMLFPNGNSLGSSLLFILMNLIPMIIAIIFAKIDGEKHILKNMFLQKESIFAYLFAIGSVAIYYGFSLLLGNVSFTGGTIFSVLAYMPWTILQGGLEECGWRWYLQPKFKINSFIIKMLVISVIWFLWHIPIYRLPWITAGSNNYIIFYLMILGNTFMFGVIREYSNGALPCVIAHILIDSMAAAMLVQSNILKIAVLVIIEILISIILVKPWRKKEQL